MAAYKSGCRRATSGSPVRWNVLGANHQSGDNHAFFVTCGSGRDGHDFGRLGPEQHDHDRQRQFRRNLYERTGNNDLSSNLVGLDIYNDDNKDIGTIKDIAMNPEGRATAYIVSVGGFLGMGDRYIAVNPSAVKVTYNDGDKKWHAKMNATADQLKAAPEFKYTGRWNGSRT